MAVFVWSCAHELGGGGSLRTDSSYPYVWLVFVLRHRYSWPRASRPSSRVSTFPNFPTIQTPATPPQPPSILRGPLELFVMESSASGASTALIRKSTDTNLMPPPPLKRIKRPPKVLDEDSYTDALVGLPPLQLHTTVRR